MNLMKKIITLTLLAAITLGAFSSCGGKNSGDGIKLSFKSVAGYDYLKTIDGEKVTINGYIATSSPVDGSFIFLMNLPYQSCPFCVPNTTELSNTIEVYPAKGEDFTAFTNRAIKVVGTLVVAENKDEPFTDKYGYTFGFKIVDATYSIIKDSELSSDMAVWQKIADVGIVDEIYSMYNYLRFVCSWCEYVMKDSTDANGQLVPGYYISPDKLDLFLYSDGAQFNYGYKDGYFEGIIDKIEAVDKNAFSDLVENVKGAKSLADKALAEIEAGNYTSETKYDENFDRDMLKYSLNNGEELLSEWNTLYYEFSNWLGSWEL